MESPLTQNAAMFNHRNDGENIEKTIAEIKKVFANTEINQKQSEEIKKLLYKLQTPTKQQIESYKKSTSEVLKKSGLDDKFTKKFEKYSDDVEEKLYKLKEFIEKGGEEITEDNLKVLSKDIIQQISYFDEETSKKLKDELKDNINEPEKVLNLLQKSHSFINANKTELKALQSQSNTILSNLNKTGQNITESIKKVSVSVIAGTSEIIKPGLEFFGGVIREITGIMGELLSPFEPFIESSKKMYSIMFGATPEQKREKIDQELLGTTASLLNMLSPGGGFYSKTVEEQNKLKEEMSKSIEESRNQLKNIFDDNSVQITSDIKTVKSSINQKTQSLGGKIIDLLENIKETVSSILSKVLYEKPPKEYPEVSQLPEVATIPPSGEEIKGELEVITENNKKSNSIAIDNKNTLKDQQETLKVNFRNLDNMMLMNLVRTIAGFAMMAVQFAIMLPMLLFSFVVAGFLFIAVMSLIFGGPFRDLLVRGFSQIMIRAISWVFDGLTSIMESIDGFLSGDPDKIKGLTGPIGEAIGIMIPQIIDIMGEFLVRFIKFLTYDFIPVLFKAIWKLPPPIAAFISTVLGYIVFMKVKALVMVMSSLVSILVGLGPIAWIALGIGYLLAFIWYFREDIWAIIEPVINWIWNGLKVAWEWFTENWVDIIIAALLLPLSPVLAFIYFFRDQIYEYLIKPLFDFIKGIINTLRKLPLIGRVISRVIPELAEGGIVEKETLAVIGEAGKEAVIPLDSGENFISESIQGDIDKILNEIGTIRKMISRFSITLVLSPLVAILDVIGNLVPLVGGNWGQRLITALNTGRLDRPAERLETPRLATGGVVTSETLATIGESGPEVVIPLNAQGANFISQISNFYVDDKDDASENILTKLDKIQESVNNIHIPEQKPQYVVDHEDSNRPSAYDPNYDIARMIATGMLGSGGM